MARRFARLRSEIPAGAAGYWTVPDDGLCLNVFLVFRPSDAPGKALLGKLDPAGAWGELAALDPARAGSLADRWILPASQLLLLESPDEAARRLARELLDLELGAVPAPRVFSEAYGRAGAEATQDPHWDLHFVYELAWPAGRALTAAPWKELALLEVARTPRAEIGRGHADVLDLVGLSAPASGAGRTRRR